MPRLQPLLTVALVPPWPPPLVLLGPEDSVELAVLPPDPLTDVDVLPALPPGEVDGVLLVSAPPLPLLVAAVLLPPLLLVLLVLPPLPDAVDVALAVLAPLLVEPLAEPLSEQPAATSTKSAPASVFDHLIARLLRARVPVPDAALAFDQVTRPVAGALRSIVAHTSAPVVPPLIHGFNTGSWTPCASASSALSCWCR
jgi:hypothetical protein